MPRCLNHFLLALALIVFALLLAGLASPSRSLAEEPGIQDSSNLGPQPPNQNQVQTQPTPKGTKTTLQPRDLLPSLLSPRKRTGSADTLGSEMSRDAALLKRSGRINTRINQNMQQLNNSVRTMRTNINRAISIRRRPY